MKGSTLEGLDVLTSGPVPPEPAEVLDSRVFRELLARLARDYDRVVLDTPSLLAVTDGAVVAGVADSAVLVVESGRTRRADLSDAVLALRAVDADVVGVVLTGTAARDSDVRRAPDVRRSPARQEQATPDPVAASA